MNKRPFRIALLGVAVSLLCCSVEFAQTKNVGGPPDIASRKSSLTITAVASADRVRITAPASVVQMRVEVYDGSGTRVWDSDIHGNVFDWHVQNGQAQRPAAGDYVCVVTVKNVAGRVTQKIGSIQVGEKDVRIAVVETGQLSAPQSQAIGPVEEDASWTILSEDQNQTTTVIAHDGTDGQIVRGRGAISFRLGDFFSGKDEEQMRLTEEGNLGIGTSAPKFKLDVGGAIRAREGFVFGNGSTLSVNDKGALMLTGSDGSPVPNAAGTGTVNTVSKWAETGGNGNLTDSSIFDNGRVGIGTNNPGARFHAVGISGSVGAGTFQLDTSNLFSTWTATYPAFEVLNTNLTNNNVSLFQFSDVASGAAHAGIGAVATNHASKFGDLFFFTKGTDGYQPRMGIYDGEVGIGTTMPNSLLDVNGNINTSTNYNIGGNRVLSVSGMAGLPNNNTFVGVGSGINNTPGTPNPMISGCCNAFFGNQAGIANTSGFDNSFFGRLAGGNNQSGFQNSFFGASAGFLNTGSFNAFFGQGAGETNVDGTLNTIIGTLADVSSGNLTNATAIGAAAFVTQSNSLVLGGITGVNGGTNTNVGIGTTAPGAKLHVVGNGLFTDNLTVDTDTLRVDAANNRVGIGTTGPGAKLHVVGGDAAITTSPFGLILKAIDGTLCWRLVVNNLGQLGTVGVTCP